MAGKIALGIITGLLLFFFGYAFHREKLRSTEIPFRVANSAVMFFAMTHTYYFEIFFPLGYRIRFFHDGFSRQF